VAEPNRSFGLGHLVYRGFATGMKHGQAEPDGIAPPDPARASRTEAKVN
jgi:hypothetical protein